MNHTLTLATAIADLETSARNYQEALQKVDPVLYGLEELYANLQRVNAILRQVENGLDETLVTNIRDHAEDNRQV